MSETILQSLTPEILRGLLQDRGYRVETGDAQGVPVLRSATNGLAFEVHFSNRLSGDDAGYADIALLAALQVQGSLSLDPVNGWNNARRFARLHLAGDLLVLTMDVSVLGGVLPAYVRTQVEIWDRLVQELIPYLRETARTLPKANGADPGGAVVQPPADRNATAVPASPR